MNRIERIAGEFDRWQQHHRPIAFAMAVAKKFSDDQAGNLVALLAYYAFLATFPLLLALSTILGLVLRNFPRLQRDLLNSAFADFPIIGAQIHDQLGVANFGNSFSLIIGLLGAFFGGRGFANALQDPVSSLWAVPGDRPGFPANYLRSIALLLLLTVGVAVTAAASAAAGVATAWGFGGLAVHLISIGVGSLLGWGYFLAACRVATPSPGPDPLDADRRGGQRGGVAAAVDRSRCHRRSPAAPRPGRRGLVRVGAGVAARGSDYKRRWWYTPSRPMWFVPSICGPAA